MSAAVAHDTHSSHPDSNTGRWNSQDSLAQLTREMDELMLDPVEDAPKAKAPAVAQSAKIVPLPAPKVAPKVDRTREYQEEVARGRLLDKLAKKTDTEVDFAKAKLTPPPVHCLPQFLQEYCHTASISAEADERMILPFALLALAGTIGSTIELQVKPGHKEPAVLWVAVVAHSGAHKSPALHHAFAPVYEWQKEVTRDYLASKKAYEAELEEWQSTPRAERGRKPTPPIHHKLKINDGTMEAVASALEENPRGITWTSDELLSFVGGLNQYKGGHGNDRARSLELWNCKPTTILRQGKEIHLERPAINLGGGIQPGVLNELCPGGREDGFFERLLITIARSEAPPNVRHGFDPRPLQEWARVMRRMIDGCEIDQFDEVKLAKFDSRAQERWFDLSDAHRAQMRQMQATKMGIAQKIEAYAARLALILHVARFFAGETKDLYEVDTKDVEAGWTLALWFEHNAFLARGLMTITDEDRLVNKVIAWIRDHGGQATLREIQMGKALGRGVTKIEMQAVLDRAQATGILTAAQGERDTRTVIYGLLTG